MAPSDTPYDEDKHFLMLLILNAGIQITQACQDVAPKMGPDVKGERLRQKFYKLKRESEQLLGKAGVEAPATPSGKKSTPAKAKATPKSTGKGRKRKADAEDNEDDDAADTPSKKTKKEVKEEAGEDAVDEQI